MKITLTTEGAKSIILKHLRSSLKEALKDDDKIKIQFSYPEWPGDENAPDIEVAEIKVTIQINNTDGTLI